MQPRFRECMRWTFNWKEHPASVFCLAMPLAFLGLGSMFILAWMNAREGRYGYLVIWIAGVTLLIVGLLPAYRTHKMMEELRKETQLSSRDHLFSKKEPS